MILTIVFIILFAGVIGSFTQFILKTKGTITKEVWLTLLVGVIVGWLLQRWLSCMVLMVTTITLWILQTLCRWKSESGLKKH